MTSPKCPNCSTSIYQPRLAPSPDTYTCTNCEQTWPSTPDLDQKNMSTWLYFEHSTAPDGRLMRTPIAGNRAQLDAALEESELVWCNYCTAAVEPYHQYHAWGLTEYCGMCDERTELFAEDMPKDYPPAELYNDLGMLPVALQYKETPRSRTWRDASVTTRQYTHGIFHRDAVKLAHQENWHTFRIIGR